MNHRRWGNHSRMKSLVSGVVLVLLAHAAHASPCSVDIARAPDAVREVITQWVEAEHDCGPPLEVRIVETSGGLYVLARDAAGHVHERVVPDAQSAGVLIASWAAAPSSAPSTGTSPEATAPTAVTGDMSIDLSWTPPAVPLAAPSTVDAIPASGDAIPATGDAIPATASHERATKWLSLGGAIGIGGAGAQGVRGEIDLKAIGAWRVGVAGTLMHVDVDPDFGRYTGYLDLVDMKAALYAAHTVDVGHWQLRATAGIGAVVTHGDGVLYDRADANEKAVFWPQISTVSPTGEASVTMAHSFAGFGVILGPVVSLVHETLQMKMGEADVTYDGSSLAYSRNALELAFFGGIRHRL